MKDQLKAVQDILLDAVEIADARERAAFLSKACGMDLALRQEVEELLQAEAEAGQFLPEQPGSSAAQAALADAAETLAPHSGPPQLELTEKPGDRIGRYKLLQKIGEGGCGVVYMAEQEEPVRRKVALKVIKVGMDTKSVVARFEAERQALALMDHPNIAKVLDAGATGTGRPFFVMELVRGIKITDYCDQNQLPTRERLELFIRVCHAVQHAHQKGIIHRDLKPSNILVTVNDGVPVPKVIDFGIAKATEGRLTDQTLFTAFEQFLGTPAYMSPEQAAMTSLDIDTRSDIYSLGVLFYELLTGKTPFDTKALLASGLDELRRTIRETEPVRPSTRLTMDLGTADGKLRPRSALDRVTPHRLAPEQKDLIDLIRGDLDAIVMKCLEKDRARRYETANGLARDIQRHLDNEPVLARPPSRLYEFQKTVQRHKVGFAATAAVIAALAGGTLVSSLEAVRARRAEREHSRLLEGEKQARRKADAQERIARQRAYASDMSLAKQAAGQNDLGRLQGLLDHQRPERGQEDLRGWEWRYLSQFCRSDALYELCRRSNGIVSLSASSDGRWVAIGEQRQASLSVWDLRRRLEIAHLSGGDGDGDVHCAFSPRQPLLAFSTQSQIAPTNWHFSIRLWDVEAQRRVGEELPLSGWCRGMAFSSDGRTLFAFTEDDRLTLWRMPERSKQAVFATPIQHGLTPPLPIAVSSDGRLAAYAAPDGWICVLDLVTGLQRWTAKAADEFVFALAFSPDGKTIASSGAFGDASIWLWDAASGRAIGHSIGYRGYQCALAFWPDGKKLASGSGPTVRLWDISDPKQMRALGRPLRGSTTEAWGLVLLPDSATLVTGCKDGSVWIWDTARVQQEQTRVTLPVVLSNWRFAPDSQSVLTLDQQGQVTRWQGSSFEEERPLFQIGTNILQSSFSGDVGLLAVAPTNGWIQVWDVSRRILLRQFASPTKRMTYNSPGLLFLAQRKRLLILDFEDRLHEWDFASGLETRFWRAPVNAFTVAVTPDDEWCLALGRLGSHTPSLLKNLNTGLERTKDLDLSDVEDSAFSPDGNLFAAASSFGGAKLWETRTMEGTALPAFSEATFSVCFSPDGRRLATGGHGESAVKLWDVGSRQELISLKGDGSMFWPTAFSADGNIIGSMNYKGVLHLWPAPSWGEIELAERRQAAASTP